MGALLVATLSVVAFAVVLTMTGVVARASKLANVAMGGVVAMLDASLSDREKEAAVRKAGISLLGGAFAVGLRFLACFAAVFAVIYAFDFAGLVPQSASLGMLLRIDFIVIISVVAMIVWWLFSRFKGLLLPGAARCAQQPASTIACTKNGLGRSRRNHRFSSPRWPAVAPRRSSIRCMKWMASPHIYIEICLSWPRRSFGRALQAGVKTWPSASGLMAMA